MLISDWSSDVCSSDLVDDRLTVTGRQLLPDLLDDLADPLVRHVVLLSEGHERLAAERVVVPDLLVSGIEPPAVGSHVPSLPWCRQPIGAVPISSLATRIWLCPCRGKPARLGERRGGNEVVRTVRHRFRPDH